MELVVFIGVAGALAVLGGSIALITVIAKRTKTDRDFPIELFGGVRCSKSPFTSNEMNIANRILYDEWPSEELGPLDLNGLRYRFRPDLDPKEVEATYNVVDHTATIPCKNVEHLYETAYTHEGSHYGVDKDRKLKSSHPYYDLIWSEKTGCVRRVRVKMGYHPYPGMVWPEED